MHHVMRSMFSFVLNFCLIRAQFSHANEQFDNQKFLDQQNHYELYWKSDNEWITFEVHVATKGWVGLGFSPSGGMKGADIVVGGVINGQPYIYDMHASQNGRPIPDKQSDCIMLSGTENATHTILKFRRKISTCDEEEDWRLKNDTTRIIYAYHREDARSETDFPMHSFGNYGTRSLMLFEQSHASRDVEPPDVTTLDFTVDNVEIPEDYHTLYWCKSIKLPKRRKHHIIKYEPIMQSGSEPFLHHILLYHCVYDMTEFLDKPEPCFNANHTHHSKMYKCTSRYLAGWAVGADSVVWGENLGAPIFEDGQSPSYMLEIHYDNSHYQKNLQPDNSGMRLYITPTLRPIEVQSMAIGMGVSPKELIIPPRQKKITLTTFCGPEFTQNLPSGGINIVGGFLHEHLIGSAVRLRHVRNGVELAPIFEDNYYDFNYQEQRNLNPPRAVLPNDTLIVECEYNSLARANVTYGGFTTKNEMCFVFVDYWPKSKNAMITCIGGPQQDTYAEAMGATFNAMESQPKEDGQRGYQISGPLGDNIPVADYAALVTWDDRSSMSRMTERTRAGDQFQRILNTGKYFVGVGIYNGSKDFQYADWQKQMKMIEPISYDYKLNLVRPIPRVPYTEPNPCITSNHASPGFNMGNQESQYLNQNQHGMNQNPQRINLDQSGSDQNQYRGNQNQYENQNWSENGNRNHNWNDNPEQSQLQSNTHNQFENQNQHNNLEHTQQNYPNADQDQNNYGANTIQTVNQGQNQFGNQWGQQNGNQHSQTEQQTSNELLAGQPDIHSAVLDGDGNVVLFWTLSPSNSEWIIFEAHVRSQGWLGIGFSPNGGMKGADIVVGWVDNTGKPHLLDMYAESNGLPSHKESQDYELLSGVKNASHIVIQFKRKLETCDEKDWKINEDTTRIIWAYDDAIPQNLTGNFFFSKHQQNHRSSKSVTLLDNKQTKDMSHNSLSDRDLTTMEFKAGNVAVPSDFHTLYWCQIFKMQDARTVGKHHMVKYEPIIQPGNEAYVHHMILYACSVNMDKYVGKPAPCFDRNSENFSPMYQCTSAAVAGWAVGGEAHKFPENVGYPVFEDPTERYFMLEMHYDNSGYNRNVVDNSGMRLFLTKNLRDVEAGTMSFGVPVGPPYQILPPGQKSFTNYGYCSSDCTNKLPTDGVNVYAGFLHTHLTGRAVRLRHIRNGKELKPLIQDNHYDFNYQEMKMKKVPTTIYPGDEFIAECVYDTSNRHNTTFGGFSTKEEMCLITMEYYPRVEGSFSVCFSLPDLKESLGVLGAENVDGETQMVTIGQDQKVSVKEWVTKNVDWDENRAGSQRYNLARKFQDVVRDGKHWVMCLSKKTSEELLAREANAENIEANFTSEDMIDKSVWNMEFHPTDGGPKVELLYQEPNSCGRTNEASSNDRYQGDLRRDFAERNDSKNPAPAIRFWFLIAILCIIFGV